MHSSQATIRGSLSSRRIPQLEKVSLASKTVNSAKSVSSDAEAVKKKQEEKEEKVLRTKADEANPELLKRALTIVYDTVAAYVDSLQSANQQVPGGVDWRLEKAKTSDGCINAEILTQKLREFLKLEHDPIQRIELILSFLVFALETSGSETEHKVVAMKDPHDSYRYRGDAHDFKARYDDEHSNELIEVKMCFQSFSQSSAFAILQDWVRRAKSDDQILDDRNRSSLILTQANTDGDSDDGPDGSDGSDAETSDMYMSDESKSSMSHGSSLEVSFV
ncbi:hypothetical protein ACEPAF_2679 [Sanghuangporus sanghuang]